MTKRRSIVGDAMRGAVAGAAATWLMDLVTTGIQQGQSERVNKLENQAMPNGKGAVANLVDRVKEVVGMELDEEQQAGVEQLVHYALGAVPGALYAVVRSRLPFTSASLGLAYGIVLWAVNDEYLNTTLGFAGPFDAYPIETHWRGLVGHAVLGVATDAGIAILH
jgi:hypothetical protein